MSTLICGSMAYDTIMVFHDRFKNHILPDQLHILNVAFLVPDMRREFGGCAGNIAYTLQMLGGDARIMATVGDDFAPYDDRLQRLGLSQDHIRAVPGSFTAQAAHSRRDMNIGGNQNPGFVEDSHDPFGALRQLRLGHRIFSPTVWDASRPASRSDSSTVS